MGSILFNAGVFIAAIVCGYRFPKRLYWVLLVLVALVLVGLAVEAYTGWTRGMPSRQSREPSSLHQWSGQGLAIVAWLLAVWGVGGSVAYAVRFRAGRGCLGIVCALLTLGLCVLESFTGYLLPDDPKLRASIGEETFKRFIVLHEIFCPLAMLIVISLWAWLAVGELRRLHDGEGSKTLGGRPA